MNLNAQIDELLTAAEQQFKCLDGQFEEAARSRKISGPLAVQIKNFSENLRSALDYSARGIYEKNCGPIPRRSPYFPICDRRKKFDKMIRKGFPNLDSSDADLVTYLAQIQPFRHHPQNRWLAKFRNYVNGMKHFELAAYSVRDEKIMGTPDGLGPVVYRDETSNDWVEFRVRGTRTNLHLLLEQSMTGIKEICREVRLRIA